MAGDELGVAIDCQDAGPRVRRWVAQRDGTREESAKSLTPGEFDDIWARVDGTGWRNLTDCEQAAGKGDPVYTFDAKDWNATVTFGCAGLWRDALPVRQPDSTSSIRRRPRSRGTPTTIPASTHDRGVAPLLGRRGQRRSARGRRALRGGHAVHQLKTIYAALEEAGHPPGQDAAADATAKVVRDRAVFDGMAEALREQVAAINETGCVIRDVEIGLCDWRGDHEGREGLAVLALWRGHARLVPRGRHRLRGPAPGGGAAPAGRS